MTPPAHLTTRITHWARTRPDAPACTTLRHHGAECDERTMGFGDVERRALLLADRLRRECAPGDRVAVSCGQGPEFVIGFLACLYAGRVAVPLPTLSGRRGVERITSVLADARPALVLVDPDNALAADSIGVRVLVVDLVETAPARSIPPQDHERAGHHPVADGHRRTDPVGRAVPRKSGAVVSGPVVPDTDAPAVLGPPSPPSSTDSAGEGARIHAFPIEFGADGDPDAREPVDGSTVAYLQYTSGSTGSPAGVRITHDNLAAALAQLHDALPPVRTGTLVSWLPFFHDMGLILGLALPLYCGTHGVTMPPRDFVTRPIRWLRACARFDARATASPDFGLALAVSDTSADERSGLDLSGLEAVLLGAEPVRAGTLADFDAAFAPYGFRTPAFTPGYGLAEATLAVTVSDPATAPVSAVFDRTALNEGLARTCRGDAGIELVSCGVPAGQEVAVVDPDRHVALPENTVGELWVRGPNVGDGYQGRTADTFGARLGDRADWLRTGDLGFRHQGRYYIAGRRKDLIIVDGRNHYPADIEATATAATPHVRPGRLTAFDHDTGRAEELVIVAELDRAGLPTDCPPERIAVRIRSAVAAAHEVMPGAVVLVEPGRVPRTSSGKVRRGECRTLYASGRLPVLAHAGRQPPPTPGR